MAHAGRPEMGVNPVERVPAVLEALAHYRAEIGARTHAVLSPGTCTPTVVRAGEKANVVPDTCEMVLDRRLLPSESADAELARVRELLAPVSTPASPITVELGPHHFEPSETRSGSPFAALVRDAVTDVTGETQPYWGTPYASDVRNLIRDAGMDAVTFGPGDIDLAHAIDEHVELAQVSAAARVLTAVASRVLLDADQSPGR
jgi:succinyl-diaminopimelate desuccinylase